jgi:hypothetical protein
MSEIKSLVDSIKDGLFDQLLNSVDQNFSEEAIEPSVELVPYLEGKPFEAETKAERLRLRQLWDDWTAGLVRTLGREKSDPKKQGIILQRILEAMPEPYRTGVEEAFCKIVKDRAKSP